MATKSPSTVRCILALAAGLSAVLASATEPVDPVAEVEVQEVPEYHERVFSLTGPTARIEWTYCSDESGLSRSR